MTTPLKGHNTPHRPTLRSPHRAHRTQTLPTLRPRPSRYLQLLPPPPYLDNDHARTVILATLEQLRQRHRFHVFGYVPMPEHVHLLLSEPKHGKREDTFRALKTQTSRKLKGEHRQFWQVRYHDFNVLTHAKFIEKLRYLHRNPGKTVWSLSRKIGNGVVTAIGSPANRTRRTGTHRNGIHWTWDGREKAGQHRPVTHPS